MNEPTRDWRKRSDDCCRKLSEIRVQTRMLYRLEAKAVRTRCPAMEAEIIRAIARMQRHFDRVCEAHGRLMDGVNRKGSTV